MSDIDSFEAHTYSVGQKSPIKTLSSVIDVKAFMFIVIEGSTRASLYRYIEKNHANFFVCNMAWGPM